MKFIGISGIAAVGKTTYANKLNKETPCSFVISTDSFLYPNKKLEEMGLLDKKGCIETYDKVLIKSFFENTKTKLFQYSHIDFDITGELIEIPESTKTLFIEGTITLTPLINPFLDETIFLETSIETARERFVNRTLEVRKDKNAAAYYKQFEALNDEEFKVRVIEVFDNVCIPNYKKLVEPYIDNATKIVHL